MQAGLSGVQNAHRIMGWGQLLEPQNQIVSSFWGIHQDFEGSLSSQS